MGYAFTSSDVAFLRSAAGIAALAEVDALPFSDSSRVRDVEAARRLLGSSFAPVVETVLLRRRAASKLDSSGGWLFTDDALQQATASAVARHRALRFAGRDVHDVTCSVGADLFALSAVAARCIGSDLDPVRLAMARNNVPGQLVVVADALRPVSRATAVTADPARRDSSGRRKWNPSDFVPPLDELSVVYAGVDLAVKCAPGIDFAVAPWADEIEVVSLGGAVREACLWTRGLATPGVSRRATVLHGSDSWTITDAEPDDCPVLAPGSWIIDPDGAVVRAGLVRHYAARHGLWQLDERIAYLSGDKPPAGVRAFRVLEHGHYTEKALKSLLKTRGVGRLEILVRGLDVDPNTLRKRLKLSGAAEASVVLTRVGSKPVFLLGQAERT
ncbi:class I SAM-dependent methyltransferase [Lentzea sp. BCCO 10_0856]|uniref:Class I SAM-dependent methyltransferase n=1 Tax=Lentzea miocenica TaxID=3095431 RepID=A0ABU4SY68_9PSEU|nr:class I SAM-dependent methyltransferase [Lentzea sp. BCCO 10_0856]MDX8030840.1 class I SAM-dependent methyltransferase [Lentzea sp. BCCO 10_0856]